MRPGTRLRRGHGQPARFWPHSRADRDSAVNQYCLRSRPTFPGALAGGAVPNTRGVRSGAGDLRLVRRDREYPAFQGRVVLGDGMHFGRGGGGRRDDVSDGDRGCERESGAGDVRYGAGAAVFGSGRDLDSEYEFADHVDQRRAHGFDLRHLSAAADVQYGVLGESCRRCDAASFVGDEQYRPRPTALRLRRVHRRRLSERTRITAGGRRIS